MTIPRGEFRFSAGLRRNSGLLVRGDAFVYNETEVNRMETKDVLLALRTREGLSQQELAEKLFVTRQAVSRWENGGTVPGIDTLRLLSKFFGVSINTILGSPGQLVCQCCGMPLKDDVISREPDGQFNEEYCRWCYADGEYVYQDMDEMVSFLAGHLAAEDFPPEQIRSQMKEQLPKLKYWKRYAALGGGGNLKAFAAKLAQELNELQIDGMPQVKDLRMLPGRPVNFAYRLPCGENVRFLDDDAVYPGARLDCLFGGDRCFTVLADLDFLLVCTHEKNGEAPELVIYKKR